MFAQHFFKITRSLILNLYSVDYVECGIFIGWGHKFRVQVWDHIPRAIANFVHLCSNDIWIYFKTSEPPSRNNNSIKEAMELEQKALKTVENIKNSKN